MSWRIEAEFSDEIFGPRVRDHDKASGKSLLAEIKAGHHLQWRNLSLRDTVGMSFRVAGLTNAVMAIHQGSPEGAVLGTVEVPVTGSEDAWTEVSTPIKRPEGRVDLYLTFAGPTTNRLMNLDWVRFDP